MEREEGEDDVQCGSGHQYTLVLKSCTQSSHLHGSIGGSFPQVCFVLFYARYVTYI